MGKPRKPLPDLEPTHVEGAGVGAHAPTKRIDIQVQGRARDPDELMHQPFGRYVLLKRLASGGMGEIFLAKHAGAGGFTKLVAIKRILAHYKSDDDHVRMFFDEAKLQALLNDRHVVQIWDMGEIDDHLFIAMEYVHGVSWRKLIERVQEQGRILHPAHACDLAIQVAKGLSYAHNVSDSKGKPLNIVHRDVNPQNLLTSFEGEVKIIDFGIAKSDINDVQTSTGTLKGKFAYMSPEQGKGDKLDRRSDIFSFGICLYELLTRKNPFKRNNVVASLAAIQHDEPTPLEELRPDCVAFSPIVERCLEKNRNKRYKDAAEVAEELIELYASGAVPTPSMPLSVWMQDLFEQEIAEHLEMLEKMGSSGGFSLRQSPLVSNPGLSQPYSAAAEASDPRRRRELHDAPTRLLPDAPEPTRAAPEPISYTAQTPAGSTLQSFPSYTSEGDGPSELLGLPSITAEGPPPLPDRPRRDGPPPPPASSSPGFDAALGRPAGDTDPTVSQPPADEAFLAAAPPTSRGRSLVLGTLVGLLVGLSALGALLWFAPSGPPEEEDLAEPPDIVEPGAAPGEGADPAPARGAEPSDPSSDPPPAPGAELDAKVPPSSGTALDDDKPVPGASVEDPAGTGARPPDEGEGEARSSATPSDPGPADPAKVPPQSEVDQPPASTSSTSRREAGSARDEAEAPKRTSPKPRDPPARDPPARTARAPRQDKPVEKPADKPKDPPAAGAASARPKTRPTPPPEDKPEPEAKAAPAAEVLMRLPSGYSTSSKKVSLLAGKAKKVKISGPEGGFTVELVFTASAAGKVSFKLTPEPFGIVRVNNVGTPRGSPIDLPLGASTSVIVKSPQVSEELKFVLKADAP